MSRHTFLQVYLLAVIVYYNFPNAVTCKGTATCEYVDEQIEELKNNLGRKLFV